MPNDIQIVPIEKEPSHRLVRCGEYFLVFDVSIFPGETSLFHEHTKDSIIICIEGADVPSRKPEDAEFIERDPIPSRDVYYRGYGKKSFVHQVQNRSTNTFRTLDIEFPKPKSTVHVHCPNCQAILTLSLTTREPEHPNFCLSRAKQRKQYITQGLSC